MILTVRARLFFKVLSLAPVTEIPRKAAQKNLGFFRKEYNQARNHARRRILAVRNPQDITVFLKEWSSGNREAADDLIQIVYKEMRKLAASYLKNQRSDHTLQPTALVHEAYMKLVDISDVSWQDRAHFFAVAAQTMRHILVDHARALAADKRGGAMQRVDLEESISFPGAKGVDVVELDEALRQLAVQDEKQSRIVELRFFGGMTVEETAHVMSISPATVKREWATARAWLFRRIKNQ